ncbi:MAG: flavodoxin domain-containing protein [Anaerolineae bacterium]|nr:MAG: flavodoxin domain-containing protein [Anaerolineae bacterium]
MIHHQGQQPTQRHYHGNYFWTFYGSTEGATAVAADVIKEEIEATGQATVELHDVAFTDLKLMETYDYLILGISTWDIGQMQVDWPTGSPSWTAST